jgi:hypothetical protein
MIRNFGYDHQDLGNARVSKRSSKGVHNKNEIKSDSAAIPSWVPDQFALKWTQRTHTDSDCNQLDMAGKIKILSNQPNWSHLKIHPVSTGSSKQVSARIIFWYRDTVCWAVGSCIVLETIRDTSRACAHS